MGGLRPGRPKAPDPGILWELAAGADEAPLE